eukprot:2171763-Pleurochrysis_carterae.AAC.1
MRSLQRTNDCYTTTRTQPFTHRAFASLSHDLYGSQDDAQVSRHQIPLHPRCGCGLTRFTIAIPVPETSADTTLRALVAAR